MARNIDVDAFLAELNAEPDSITFGGNTYEIPVEIPFLAVEEAQKIDGQTVNEEQIFKVIGLLIGGDAVKQMRENRMGVLGANYMMNELFKVISERQNALVNEANEEEDEGSGGPKAAVSQLPQTTSSESSVASKPTSGASFSLGQKNSNGSG